MKRIILLLSAVLLTASCGHDFHRSGNQVTIPCGESVVRLQVVAPGIVRVSSVPGGKFADRQSLAVVPQQGMTDYEVTAALGKVRLATDSLVVEVYKASGAVHLFRADGTPLLQEGQAFFQPVAVEGKKGWSVRTCFEVADDDDAFYGLGQHQSGEFDHRGRSEELYQYNTKVSVPFVISPRGYGVLFDAYSLSRWGNPAPYSQLGALLRLYDKDGVEGALTGTYIPASGVALDQREDSLYYENEQVIRNLPDVPLSGARVVYEGFVEAPETADYHFIQYYAGFQQTFFGGEEVMSRRWRPAWNPNSYKFTVHLEKGQRTPVRIEWEPDGDVSYIGLRVAPPQPAGAEGLFSFWSEFEPQQDYYFIVGDDYDQVIAGYRRLTGKAPVMPKWALGFWQSRERYATQEDLVETLAGMRRRHIPVDNIVQDWQYWKDDQWGSHEFDETRYPDPEKMMDDVHAMHARLMISVWPKFYTNTAHYQELKAAGYAYTHAEDTGLVDWLGHEQTFYDAYAEGGRQLFWRQIDESLYSRYGRKIDAWWMDASEPNLRDCLPMDYFKWLISPTALGPSTEYLNAYSLVNADAIYNGQRASWKSQTSKLKSQTSGEPRVFLLTRSGFAGEQRYSTATWSGDIGTRWEDMRAQMTAGLNYSMSGIPFWGMDQGGFCVEKRYVAAQQLFDRTGQENEDLKEWRELQTRWNQFGAFIPLFRAHGQWPLREIWNIAPDSHPAYKSFVYYDQLRYRLMPYLYSLAGWAHFRDYTLMRALVMDFNGDRAVENIGNQWMLGPALMACPVGYYKARNRSVYFPKQCGWYDLYTGEHLDGGQRLVVSAPYEQIPVYVREGAIIPFGPEMEWSDEKPAELINLYVYAGQDGQFQLYEDEGTNYNYEKGKYATIDIAYDDALRTVTFAQRQGQFPGMLKERRFNVVLVTKDAPKPLNLDNPEGRLVNYNGKAVSVQL